MAKAVIATVAEDRPGLVAELSEQVLALGLNIEDSRMTVLGGEFAVLMSVAGEEAALDELESRLEARAAGQAFVYLFRRTSERPSAETEVLRVAVESMDHPGIVHGVTRFFSSRGANIRELATETVRAPHTGAPIFNLTMQIEMPAGDAPDALDAAFQSFCAAEGLDGRLLEPDEAQT